MPRRGILPFTIPFFAAVATTMFFDSSSATEVSLNFGSLPSSQGWTYSTSGTNSGVPESSVFSVSGGVLVLNTMSTGSGGTIQYTRSQALNETESLVIAMRARLTNIEGDAGAGCYGYGFAVSVNTGTRAIQFGFLPDRIRDDCPVPRDIVFLDNTIFHDYRIEMLPNGNVRLFVDGVLRATTTVLAVTSPPRLGLGDQTGNTNARAEITSYRVVQPAAAVPSTSAFGLLAAAAAMLGAGGWTLMRRRAGAVA